MRSIRFTYRHLFRHRTVMKTVPEFIHELTQKQYVYMMRIASDADRVNDDEFTGVLSGIPVKVLKKATAFEKYKLGEIFESMSGRLPFHQIKIKSFVLDNVRYDGPTDFLNNMSFLEFVFADSYFMRYMAGEESMEFKLVACLYRRHVMDEESELFEGDTREKFSGHRIEKRANEFKKLNHEIITGIIYNYSSIRKLIENKYTYLFPKEPVDGELEEKGRHKPKTQGQNFNGWAVTFKKFVDEDLVHEDKYAEMNAHRVLEVINNRIMESIKNG